MKYVGVRGGKGAKSQHLTSHAPRPLSTSTRVSVPNHCNLNTIAADCMHNVRCVCSREDLSASSHHRSSHTPRPLSMCGPIPSCCTFKTATVEFMRDRLCTSREGRFGCFSGTVYAGLKEGVRSRGWYALFLCCLSHINGSAPNPAGVTR